MEQGGRKGKAALPPSSLAPKKCPRCDSTNTKFCYFNNYSSSQPRHFCKACRRYWTEGGTLRNVPQGGASTRHRRNKRPRKSSSSASFSSSSASTSNDHHHHHHHHNSRLLLANSSPAEVGVDPLLMPPPPPPFFYGGGLGLPPFHPGSGIGGDLTGFPAAVAEEMAPPPPPQGNPLLLPGFGFPLVEQQLLAPFDGAGLVAHQPRAPPAFSQQMINATVFSTTTAGPATTAAAAGSDRGEPFWVTGFGGGSGQGSSRWGPHNSFDQGSGPRPPPSSFI